MQHMSLQPITLVSVQEEFVREIPKGSLELSGALSLLQRKLDKRSNAMKGSRAVRMLISALVSGMNTISLLSKSRLE